MKHRTFPWLLLAGLTVTAAAHAGEPASADAGFTPGMKAAIDPVTGKLRQPTAAEMSALQVKAAQNLSGVRSSAPRNEAEAQQTLRRLPNGGYKIRVPQDRMSTLTATVQADGSVRVGHGSDDTSHEATPGAAHE